MWTGRRIWMGCGMNERGHGPRGRMFAGIIATSIAMCIAIALALPFEFKSWVQLRVSRPASAGMHQDRGRPDTTDAVKQRVAVLMSGRDISHDARGRAMEASQRRAHVKRWADSITSPLAAVASVHVFVCVEPGREGHQALFWAGLTGMLIVPLSPPHATDYPDQFTRAEGCYRSARRFASKRSNFRFTHFLRARPDLIWLGPIELDLAATKVQLRARDLFRSQPLPTPATALSAPHRCYKEHNVSSRVCTCGGEVDATALRANMVAVRCAPCSWLRI